SPVFRIISGPIESRCYVLRSEGGLGARRRCVRTRNRHCCKCPRAEWWPDRDVGCLPECLSKGGHVVGGSLPPPCHLSISLLLRSRRPDVLRPRNGRSIPTRSFVRQSYPQGREASRITGSSADQVRVGHQRYDRDRNRPQCAVDITW